MITKPIYIFYHGPNCTDGFGSAFTAWLRLGDNTEGPRIHSSNIHEDYYRPPGTSLNADYSAVKLTHTPTGISESCSMYPANYKNYNAALAGLRKKVNPNYSIQYIQKQPADSIDQYDIPDDSMVYFLDVIAQPKELLELSKRCNVVVIDHHITNLHAIQNYLDEQGYANIETAPFKLIFDIKKSGAVLTWEYFFPDEPVPDLLLYIQDRDLWNWELKNSKEFSAALWQIPHNFAAWEQEFVGTIMSPQTKMKLNAITNMISHGKILLNADMKTVNNLKENKQLWYYEGQDKEYNIAVVNSPVVQSELAASLLENHDANVALIWYMKADGTYYSSLRSRKEDNPITDVGNLAVALGGGGHATAAGVISQDMWWQQGTKIQ